VSTPSSTTTPDDENENSADDVGNPNGDAADGWKAAKAASSWSL